MKDLSYEDGSEDGKREAEKANFSLLNKCC